MKAWLYSVLMIIFILLSAQGRAVILEVGQYLPVRGITPSNDSTSVPQLAKFTDFSDFELKKEAQSSYDAAFTLALRKQPNDGAIGATAEEYLLLLHQAAEMGSTYAANQLGVEFDKGELVPRDLQKAAYYFGRSALLGNDLGQVNLALLKWEESGFSEEILSLMEAAASQGNVFANFWIGQEYFIGEYMPRSLDLARMYLTSAGAGFSLAQYTLGELALYEFLEEGKQTLHQAVAYMRTASELGHVAASVKLGILYADRRLPILNKEKSEYYFTLAVEQGYKQAGFYLAWHKIYFAINQDELDAARREAELEMTSGNDNAAYLLGEIYRRGLGVNPDPEKALEMYLRASEAGFA